MDPDATVIIHVVGFAPDFTGWHGDTARVGGFDWRPSWHDAAQLVQQHLEDGNTGHDLVFRSVLVPRGLSRDEITAYLDEHRELFEVPIPEDWT